MVLATRSQKADVAESPNLQSIIGENLQKTVEELNKTYNALNTNYHYTTSNEINLDKTFVPIKINSTFVDQILANVEKTRSQLHELSSSLSNMSSPPLAVVSKIDDFVQIFASDKDVMDILSQDERIARLEKADSILRYLKDARTFKPDTLHTLLHRIIDFKYAIPKNAEDKVAFAALSTLYYGTRIYVAVMFFLLKQYTFLANYYYNTGDLDKYNHNFIWAEIIFSEFKHSLVFRINNKPLVYDVINIFNEVIANKVYTIDEQTSKDLREKLDSLNNIKEQLRAFKLPMLSDRPVEIAGLSLKKKGKISAPIGQWKDGIKVSYAIQSTHNGIYSKIGEWYGPTNLGATANPFLTIPVDPQRNTRMIFRRFDKGVSELVGVLTKSSRTSFRDIDRDFYNAASDSDENSAIDEAQIWLDNGAHTDAVFEQGKSAIHAAAQSGNTKFAKKFLIGNNTTDVNARDANCYTPVYLAAQAGKKRFVELLVKNGADVNLGSYADNLTPLHIAAFKGHVPVIEALMQSSEIDVNAKDNEGFTPLHNAVLSGVPAVKALTANNKTDVNAKSKRGITPLFIASLTKNRDVARTLLENKNLDINAKAVGDLTALHFASLLVNLKMVKFLTEQSKIDVNAKAIENWTPLLLASATGNQQVVSVLLQHGANIEAKTANGWTALGIAKARHFTEIASFLESKGGQRKRREAEYYDDYDWSYGSSFENTTFLNYIDATSGSEFTPSSENYQVIMNGSDFTYPENDPVMMSGSSKPSSWIHSFGHIIVNTVMGLSQFRYFPSAPAIHTNYFQPPKNVAIQSSDPSSTLLLLDVFVRKFTGRAYISTNEPNMSSLEATGYALRITEDFEKLLNQAVDGYNLPSGSLNLDFSEVQTKIAEKIVYAKFSEIREVLRSYLEKASHNKNLGTSDKNKFDMFLFEFDKRQGQTIEKLYKRCNPSERVCIKEPHITLDSKSYLNTSACDHITYKP